MRAHACIIAVHVVTVKQSPNRRIISSRNNHDGRFIWAHRNHGGDLPVNQAQPCDLPWHQARFGLPVNQAQPERQAHRLREKGEDR